MPETSRTENCSPNFPVLQKGCEIVLEMLARSLPCEPPLA